MGIFQQFKNIWNQNLFYCPKPKLPTQISSYLTIHSIYPATSAGNMHFKSIVPVKYSKIVLIRNQFYWNDTHVKFLWTKNRKKMFSAKILQDTCSVIINILYMYMFLTYKRDTSRITAAVALIDWCIHCIIYHINNKPSTYVNCSKIIQNKLHTASYTLSTLEKYFVP